MPKSRRGKRRGSKSNNSCCPLIRVRCGRRGKGGKLGDVTPAFLRTAEQVLADRRAATTVARRKAIKVYCSVKVGAKTRRVHVTNMKATIAKIVRAQQAKRCVPKVNGKLVTGTSVWG